MNLTQIFDKRSIVTLNSSSKIAAFYELIDVISDLHPRLDRDDALSVVSEREQLMNTGIIPGIALPHAVCISAERIDGAIGISQAGIDYGSFDKAPVHIIFMILTHPDQCDASLRFLRSLALVLNAPDIVSAMLNDQKPETIYELLSKTYND